MITITFPDGAERQYEAGTTSWDVAKSISQGLAKNIVAACINGETWDLTRPIEHNAHIKFYKWTDDGGKATFWHSSAHLLAEAVESIFPGTKFGIGPAIDRGFYYDIDLGDRKIEEEDLRKIEVKMAELAAQKQEFKREKVGKAEAIAYFEEKGDPYKLDLLKNLEDGSITFYKQGDFVDLCRGPHLPDTGFIKAIKLTSIAGAYWRGDEKNKMLTRIYGITFPTQKELDEYLIFLGGSQKTGPS